MVQPASKRLVTEQKLFDTLASDVPTLVDKQRARRLEDQFQPVHPGKVPQNKAVVSLTSGVEVDGWGVGTVKKFHPPGMYDIAECNWNAQTLLAYGQAWRNMSKSNNVATGFDFTTMLEGQMAMITTYKLAGILQHIRVWIDDVEVTDWYLGKRSTGVLQVDTPVINCTTDATNHYVNINFAKRGLYKIRVTGIAISGTLGLLHCNAEGKFHKPKKQRVFGVVSDSMYDTIYATNTSLNSATEICSQTGWKQWNLAVGGSGFINPSIAPDGPHNYASDAVFAAMAKAPPFDLLLLNGSLNDLAYPEADVLTAMRAFFTRFKSVRPDTPIVWQGLCPQSYFENNYTSPVILARELAQNAVALAEPNVIGTILPGKEDWLTGTGNTNAPNGTGNQDWLVGPDGVHFSPFGTRFNGHMVANRMSSMATWKV